MTEKQRKQIVLLETFIDDILRHKLPGGFGVYIPKEVDSAMSSEEAFLLYESKGVRPIEVDNPIRYCQLVEAQRSMAMMEKMWREDIEDGILFINELKERDDRFVSDEQYELFCKWVDKTFKKI